MRNPFGRDMTLALVRKEVDEIAALLATMTVADLIKYDTCFEAWMHEGQIEPSPEGWRTWLMQAGRGYGKTRAGAEWVAGLALGQPCRIALVGATIDEARAVMVEGESGLLSVLARRKRRVVWEPAMKRLRFSNGSVAQLYSGENPDGLRGGTHHFAWCDELAKWAKPDETWDNLQMALRAGMRPRALVTTTPRPIPLLKRIGADPLTITTRGRTTDNLVLEDRFLAVMRATYAGTRLGRQELDGELIEDIEGTLWTRAMLEACRASILPGTGRWQPQADGGGREADAPFHRPASPNGPPPRPGEELVRVVIGVDPPASEHGDACGIIVAGRGANGLAYLMEDATIAGQTPVGWAEAVSRAARRHGADRVVAEVNNGGDMVTALLRQVDPGTPVKAVHASRGKAARAEPVAALYERGLVRHLGGFPELEDQLCGMTSGLGYHGPGRSPDRADALVWALTELMLGGRAEPAVRVI
ncbi:DNA-packaging protein [Sphingomonas sp.]|uniref:DNA-packaging protein n=1 Tax=Sphingomonas sp. TaxID=28214 RepID=UPI002E0FB73F